MKYILSDFGIVILSYRNTTIISKDMWHWYRPLQTYIVIYNYDDLCCIIFVFLHVLHFSIHFFIISLLKYWKNLFVFVFSCSVLWLARIQKLHLHIMWIPLLMQSITHHINRLLFLCGELGRSIYLCMWSLTALLPSASHKGILSFIFSCYFIC